METVSFRRCISLAVIAVALSILNSCSGKAQSQTFLTSEVTKSSVGSFELTVLDETYLDHAQAREIRAVTEITGDVAIVTIVVSAAAGLKALYFELAYDAASYKPASCEPTSLLGSADELLSITRFSRPGLVDHGQVLISYDQKAGFNGSGQIAQIRFDATPFSLPRLAGAPPMSQSSAPEATWDRSSNSLSWDYCNQGDYDQNGEVNITDLTPIALYFGQAGEFERMDVRSVVDGDGNGEINLVDITPIAVNYLKTVDNYSVFYSTVEDLVPDVEHPHHVLAPLAQVTFGLSEGNPAQNRLSYSQTLQQVAPNGWLWVQPWHSGELGAPSNAVSVGTATQPGNLQPEASFNADPNTGNAPLVVLFDATSSTDPDGQIATHEWDWLGLEGSWDWEDQGAETLASHTFLEPGSYTVTLRVTDNEGGMDFTQQVITVQVDSNLPPIAALRITSANVLERKYVHMTAIDSTDPDGEIVTVDWDYEGDGVFDHIGTEDNVRLSTVYMYNPGEYRPTVRIWDNNGAAAIATVDLVVPDDLDPVVVLNANPLSGTTPLDVSFQFQGTHDPENRLKYLSFGIQRYSTSLADRIEDGQIVDFSPFSKGFLLAGIYECTLSATDSIGQRSEATVTIEIDGFTQTEYTAWGVKTRSMFLSLGVFEDVPCIVVPAYAPHLDPAPEGESLLYFRALDETGTDWADPVTIDLDMGAMGGWPNLIEVAGHPAVSWFDKDEGEISYCRALDPRGDVWGEIIHLGGGMSGFGGANALAVIDGSPSIVYSDGSRVYYRRAADVLGTSWNERILIDQGTLVSVTLDLTEVAGSAGIIYSGVGFSNFAYLNSPDGTTGIDIRSLGNYTLEFQAQLHIVQGNPAIFSGGTFIRANDEQGLDWPEDATEVISNSYNNSTLVEYSGGLVAFSGGKMSVSIDPYGAEWFEQWDTFNTINWTEAVVVQDGIGVAYLADDENGRFVRFSWFR